MTLQEAKEEVRKIGPRYREASIVIREYLEKLTDKELELLYDEMKSDNELNRFLHTRLSHLPPKYHYLVPGMLASRLTLLGIIEDFRKNVDDNAYGFFIKDKTAFIGFIFYEEEPTDHTIVRDSGAFDFNRNVSSDEVLKDLLTFPDKLLETHRVVRWDVFVGNPIKRAYDIYAKRHNAAMQQDQEFCYYERRNDDKPAWTD